MPLRLFESIWPVGAVNHVYAIKPIGKILHGNASACDTDDELLAEPEDPDEESKIAGGGKGVSDVDGVGVDSEALALVAGVDSEELDCDITTLDMQS